ncbi:hypothetical protein BU58_40220 [Escherichia coli O26:H11 str. 2011C-3274]|nr:hypothetical protein BU58_40220 [Escherichia coli O26:H11 str. 2011C-3274]
MVTRRRAATSSAAREIRFFDGTKEVKFQTPIIFINFENISDSTLKLMTTLRRKLKFDFWGPLGIRKINHVKTMF